MKTTILFYFLCFVSCFSQSKINGVSFVASNTPISTQAIQPVIQVNANWVTLMPFGFMKTISESEIQYNSKKQWWGETKEGILKTAKAFKKEKIKLMLKPQIWIPNGGFTGHIKMKEEKEWLTFEKNYENFILDFAQVAQEADCELFCIGTELNNFVISRPVYWKKLIEKVKKIYKGKITYAENWDTYSSVAFWDKVDYIGIDAYFPLSNEKTPTLSQLKLSWNTLKEDILTVHKKHKKSILFTEFGYQSKDYTAKEPWNHGLKNAVNLDGQTAALQALFSFFWQEKWFAGGFLWKWYDTKNAGGINDTDYTIQNKPAEKTVASWYKKMR